jgi:DNA polymerase III subunit gamma/tau
VLQRMAVLQAVPAQDEDPDPDAADTARLAALMPADETQLLYSLCLHGRSELGLAPDEYAALTMVLLRLLAFKPSARQASNAATATNNLAEKKTLNRVEPAATAVASSASISAPIAVAIATPISVPIAAPGAPPPGQVLHVLEQAQATHIPPDFQEKRPENHNRQAQPATKPIAIQVRVQADSRADNLAGEAAGARFTATEEGDFWHPTVQQLISQEAITAMVRELALQSQLLARDTDQWILRVERESLNHAGNRERLQAALKTAGFDVRLVVEVGRVGDSPAKRNAAAIAERQLAAEKLIFDDPFVQEMMRDYGAKIVPGSIKPA